MKTDDTNVGRAVSILHERSEVANCLTLLSARHVGLKPDLQSSKGFTLVEMIIVIVITGIIGGIVAMFIKAPVQGYVDSARRAELTDIADTAVRRMARDIRTAVPNSVRLPASPSTYIEFLPTRDGGRYRADSTGGGLGCGTVANSVLDFAAPDTCFEIVGTQITFDASDEIVVGSTQSDGNAPYQDPTAAACNVPATTACIRRPLAPAGVGLSQVVKVTSAYALPAFAELPSQRFDVVDGAQQAVTYACEGTLTLDASGNGQARLVKHWGYGFNPVQVAPGSLGGTSAILADKVSACAIDYDFPNQRFGLVAVRLTLTSSNESVSLYNEIHVNNAP